MIVWQVNATAWDSNHKLFVIANSSSVKGRSKKSKSVVTLDWAKQRPTLYYFYIELIK